MDVWNNRFLRKKILLLVTDLEVYGQKDFGTNLKRFLFEGITNNNIETLKDNILSSILTYIYEITVTNIVLVPDTDNNLVSLTIEYYLNISQTPDQITVQFT